MNTFKKWAALSAIAGATVLLGACASSGMGGGEINVKGEPSKPVMFSWKSNDGGITGTMVATLPDATYQGRFFQITQQTQSDSLAPLWVGWSRGWNDWPYWGGYGPGGFNGLQFTTRYSGKVLANLQSPSGQYMRCRLHMMNPREGMSGGGVGECEIANGPTIQAQF